MILGIDAGNTRLRCGFFGKETVPVKMFAEDMKNLSSRSDIARVLSSWVDDVMSEYPSLSAPSGGIYSSVVPRINPLLDDALSSLTGKKPVCVSSSVSTGFEIRYDTPETLGADRITNAAAALSLYPDENIIVADIGTAATFCVLLAEKIFDGGLIAPGPGTAAASLAANTAQLYRVDISPDVPLVGKNTSDGLRAGIFYSTLAMTEGIVQRIERQYGRAFRFVLTGGGADMIRSSLSIAHDYDPLLTMKGLRILHDMNA